MNSFYGVQIRRDINESYYCKSEIWMKTEFGKNVLNYRKLPIGIYIVKMKKNDGLDDDCDIKNTLPAGLGAFILSKRIMNSLEKETGFILIVYTMDIRIACIERKNFGKYWTKEI